MGNAIQKMFKNMWLAIHLKTLRNVKFTFVIQLLKLIDKFTTKLFAHSSYRKQKLLLVWNTLPFTLICNPATSDN